VAHGVVAYLLSDPEEIVLRREQQRLSATPQDPSTPST
jgi:hypothetical protein